MTNQGIEHRRISVKDRDLIISSVEALGEIDLRNVINRLSLGLRAYATIQDPDLRGNVIDVAEDMWNEELVLTLLTTVSEISAKNDGVLFFPDNEEERIYQPEMIKILGKKRYEEVKGQELDVFLDGEDYPDEMFYSMKEDWERILKLPTNPKP